MMKKTITKIYLLLKYYFQNTKIMDKIINQLPYYIQGFEYGQNLKPYINNSKEINDSNKLEDENPLQNYFYNHKQGKGITKWDHYFDIYHHNFKKFVGGKIIILEIGVLKGGSLEMWRNYFGNNSKVLGVDISENCKKYENEYTEIIIGDQQDRNFWRNFKSNYPPIDILIDDGGHKPEQQINTFEEMFPHINPGGIYLCEDLHGLHNGFSYYLQGMLNNLNQLKRNKDESYIADSNEFQSLINSIHFYPYVTVIEKSETPLKNMKSLKMGTEW